MDGTVKTECKEMCERFAALHIYHWRDMKRQGLVRVARDERRQAMAWMKQRKRYV